ncbi:MAG TPA: thioredoxin family protein [Steroidobacteraceae bacterium]|nr:thioredoxin family protein [Steroidobacteraceae bacterium]
MEKRARRIAFLCLAAALGAVACQRAAPPAAPASPAAHADGIAWFDGSVDAAFAAAAAQHRLVFLYWGASWCPPCHDLRAQVFSRRDFQEKLRQFVAVHLDGDAPGAQRAGEAFHVLGYPTVLVLTADRREMARIAGGGDLASYAGILDLALDSVRPLPELLAGLRAGNATALSDGDCRRLAWNGWDLDPREQPAQLSAMLQLAAARCPPAAVAERDRLTLTAANLAAGAERKAIESGRPASARLAGLLDAVAALLADHARALRSGDAVLALGEDYFVVARLVRPAAVAALRTDWFALMDAIEHDARYGDSTRLDSAAGRLLAAKSLDPQGRIPAAVAAQARATLDAWLARDYDPDTRAGVVNSAEWVLTYLDDKARLRALLEQEIGTSKTPYYYLADLADLDEQEGNKAQALQLLERAYRESSGPATRFQWGALYVAGLLRMSPQDEPRIRAASLEVLGELDGPDRIHARARARLDKLDAALIKWAADTQHTATLQVLAQRWGKICAALPESDPVRGECPGLVGVARRG